MTESKRFDVACKIVRIMKGTTFPWFIAAGWAVDLFLNRITREHKDIEIAIFREDQLSLQSHLKDWNFKKIKQGKPESWPVDEQLELPIHEIHAFNSDAEPPKLEILLNERDGSNWIFRRNQDIKRALTLIAMHTEDGIPFLAPEIVLLFKAKSAKPCDEKDFENMIAKLDTERLSWLRKSIEICHPGHCWLDCLASR